MGASALHGERELWGESEVCSVAVIYEDDVARELALQVCTSLTRKFNCDPEFAFSWWRFKYLGEPAVAREALQAARRADLILVAVNGMRDLPAPVKAWFENWLLERKAPGGALVTILRPGEEQNPALSRSSYFQSVADRARLDYLPLGVPGSGQGEAGGLDGA